ncbi:Eco57I restriction-modification methylase domain-containing protein [Chloroflexota bacterium]
MSKALLQKVITNGADGNLNDFFLSVSNFYTEKDDDLDDYNDERFSDFKAIGEINFEDSRKLVVVTANATRDLTERSGKKDQYEKAKKILKFYTRYDAGIFVFSDNKRDFRLSLVYGTPDATRTVWSNFRRFTYYASPVLTNKTFLDRVGTCSFASLNIIKDAFSVEKVTKDFYKQIADWYFWAVQNATFPKDAETEANGRNNAVIRLITRLIFIWFMRERELVPADLFKEERIAALLKSVKPEETTYYKAILQNLFFATLNTRIQDRAFRFRPSYRGGNNDYIDHGVYRYEEYFNNREDMLIIFKDIPFLNGGLFDCLDWSAKESGTGDELRFDGFSDKDVGLNVPNYLFFGNEYIADLNAEYGTRNKVYHVEGILNTLSAYNFTIDENDPNDSEVALDPELLGKVFENLLASFNPETATTARKATGSYYTPREIVGYMVTQSLKQYFKTHLEDITDIDHKLDELLSPVSGEATNPFNTHDSEKIVTLTEGLRIVDPAVGSGAFPMGILNKLVSVLDRVDHDNRLWQQAQLRVIENLPDPVSKQKAKEQINLQFTMKNSNYGRKLYLIQRCIYGVDIQPIAIEIAKLRFFIALLVDETIDKSRPNWGIEPLPNMDFKLIQGNSLVSEFMGINLDNDDSESYGKLMKDETDELIAEFQNKKNDFQIEPDRTRKAALKNDIEALILRIFESKLQNQKADYFSNLQKIKQKYGHSLEKPQYKAAFDQEIATIDKKYGFSLTQAEKDLKEFSTGQKMKPFFAWRLYFAEVFHEKDGFDIVIANPPYISFGLRGTQSMTEQEKAFLKRTYPDSAEYKISLYAVFMEKAVCLANPNGIQTYIVPDSFLMGRYFSKIRGLILRKNRILELLLLPYGVFEAVVGFSVIYIFQRNISSDTRNSLLARFIDSRENISNRNWKSFSYPQEYFKGLKHNRFRLFFDRQTMDLVSKVENETVSLGAIIDFNSGLIGKEGKDSIVSENKVNKHWLPGIISGGEIRRFILKPEGNYILYLKEKIHSGYECVNYFEDKLFMRQTGDSLICAIDDIHLLCLNNVHVGNLRDKTYSLNYIAGIINSKLLNHYYRALALESGRTMAQTDIETLENLPIKKADLVRQQPLIDLVQMIISITKDSDYLSNLTKQTKVKELEAQIDHFVYRLYDLTEEEKAIVEGTTPQISPTEDIVPEYGDEYIEEEAQVEIILIKDKETPGTWRYKEQKEDHPLTIYLTKDQVKELGNPESIKITVTAA